MEKSRTACETNRKTVCNVLNEPFLRVLGLMNGKNITAYFSGLTGISQRTLGKPLTEIRDRTLEKGAERSRKNLRRQLEAAGYAPDEAANWIANHPGSTMPGAMCSAVVYDAQIDGVMAFPNTMALARSIDELSTSLLNSRLSNDLNGFKATLLGGLLAEPAYYLRTSDESGWTSKPPLLLQLESASRWTDLDEVWPTVVGNVTFSLLARWDVEFCSQYFRSYEPRPMFSQVMPRVGPAVDLTDLDNIPVRRGMFRYPVRRLIDIMACMGEFVRTGRWPDRVPGPKDIDRFVRLDGNALTNWRDGTKKFTLRDFSGLWQQLCSRAECVASPPWPLFIAATTWQDLLVKANTNSKAKRIYLFEDHYRIWWDHHYSALKAKGCTFGTTPWPECLNAV